METLSLLYWGFDSLLVIGLFYLAWQALASPDMFKSIVLFISFGLLMALAWVRLNAPDIALAEAAIGAGLTGALLLAAYARLKDPRVDESNSEEAQPIIPHKSIEGDTNDE
ncbi:Na(+)/H(+) antiporter subunit B [Shewanella frigidimarina]|uniref:Na(+)/H(+) antiporter subunit B n=2 Tax=Shewanella TaxID=22 RepID=UPI000F4D81A5|nr:DUF4040 domain-containing protein [Shewanella frigidimarina]MBB1381245.1 DUF4040 domain-containing protein [Shewanella sp. SR41-2]RPA63726.1 DUF4040 domain-containing protein [Shewanella frigidimarina]